jgi:hypothetical protein
MSASTEGTNLSSWIENREAFRQKARDAVEKLGECQRRLLVAVGNRPADTAVTFSDETVSGIVAVTQEAVTALQAAEAELSQIASVRDATQSAQISLSGEAFRTARQRLQKKAEQAAERKYSARKRQSWIKAKALRLASIGVLLATFYVLYKF